MGCPSTPVTVETHVSVLVFLDDVVLKYKKPVALPYVDLTDRAARRRACEAEVAVNRRLCPDVYLGVADVSLGGLLLDHAVVMRRLDPGRSLAALVARRDPALPDAVGAVAAALAAFHTTAGRNPEVADHGRAPAVVGVWADLLDGLAPFAGRLLSGPALDEVGRLARRYLAGRGGLFDARADGGFVCDGHGDLLGSDVFVLDDGPRLLDAVEFDDRLRHVDVAADVAFLAMDLEHHGAPEQAAAFVAAYQRAAGTELPPSLFDFYVAERACVRCLVACERHAQGAPGAAAEARRLLALARRHLRSARVVLGVVSGAPGTGKSTAAAAAGDALGWPVLSADDVRHELFGRGASGGTAVDLDAGPHQPEANERTYATLLERAGTMLRAGRSVLLDATFAARRHQEAAERLAAETSSDLAVVACTLPGPVHAERLRRRAAAGPVSADEAVAASVAARAAAWSRAVPLRTDRPPDQVAARLRAALTRPAGTSTDGAVSRPR